MICFDTAPLIWGVRREASAGQEEMIERAQRYLAYLDTVPKKKGLMKVMMVPAPALAEFLVGCRSEEQRESELRVIEQHFFVAALDTPAACLAAELESNRKVRAMREKKENTRDQIRIDAMIVAIAIRHSAKMIITHNLGDFKQLADGRIEVCEIPQVQGDLPFPHFPPE
jgi:predicted nucleic acid-binding protein